MSQCCLGGVSLFSWWCLPDVSVVSRLHLGRAFVVSRWCLAGVSLVSRWCLGDASVVSCWCLPGVLLVSRRCLGGVLVASWWCLSGLLVLVVPLWCLNGVDGLYIGVSSRERLGVNLLATQTWTLHILRLQTLCLRILSLQILLSLLSLSLSLLSLSLFSSTFYSLLRRVLATSDHENAKASRREEGRGKEGRTAGRKEERDKGKGLAPECCVHLPICTYYFQTAASRVQFTMCWFQNVVATVHFSDFRRNTLQIPGHSLCAMCRW